MKKNRISVCYVVLVLAICALPLVCMSCARTNDSTENRRLAEFPAITVDGKLNTEYLSGLGSYYEDHFAFRNEIVGMDGKIQSLFGVSSVDTVIKGKDGWLYYTASADDFQGLNVMSDREVQNAIRNLRLMKEFVTDKGAAFVYTVAPNKNSLYPEHMPYYYVGTELGNNMSKIAPLIEKDDAYADLFDLFGRSDETLYMKRDSHWNNKGALMAANTLMTALKRDFDPFATVAAVRKKDAVGDLGRMAYSVFAQPEWNYAYELPGGYTYTDTQDVEAALVATQNPSKTGSLLMFRDSFANTLIPILAEHYRQAVFSKAAPYPLERYFSEYHPDDVIVEKVERNLRDFSRTPPIMSAPKRTISGTKTEQTETSAVIGIAISPDDGSYYRIEGSLPAEETPDAVYVQIGDDVYEAFTVSSDESDNGFLLYVKKEALAKGVLPVCVIEKSGGRYITVCRDEWDLSEGVEE